MTFLQNLLDWAEPQLAKVRTSANPQKGNADCLILVAARHVASAKLGTDLFRNPDALGNMASSATVQTASLLMVFGSGNTSIDLCASALLRLKGDLPKVDREHDFKKLQEKVRKNKSAKLTEEEQLWFDCIETEGSGLIQYRHAALHRIVRQSATVGGVGPSYAISHSSEVQPSEDAFSKLSWTAQFAEERWRQFVEGLSP